MTAPGEPQGRPERRRREPPQREGHRQQRREGRPEPAVRTPGGEGEGLPRSAVAALPAIIAREVTIRFRPYSERKPTLRRHGLRALRRAAAPVVALDRVSLTVARGQALGVVGANGAGKTTLLRVLAGTLPPDGGTVEVYGAQAPTLLSLNLGFNRKLSGRRNVYLGGLASGLSKAEIDAMFDDIVDYSELGDAIDRPMGTYSSGMFARLAFAVAMRQEPDILLLDEVLSVGDEAFKRKSGETMRLILERAGAVVMVSHGLGRLQQFCDTFAWLDRGRLMEVGDPKRITAMYRRHVGVPEDVAEDDD